jgi:tripartite-type tricarboxylate transporter receptor subunit TctC
MKRAWLALLLITLATPAFAQPYPNRTASIVVPFPAGGSVDVVARLLVQKLNESIGPNFIVENRAGGAGGAVGANAVARAAPDGYTLMFTASIHIITPFINSKIPYDAVKDFTPISLVAAGPLLVSTAPNVPADNLKQFFDLVRKEPAKYTFATSSYGSAGHLAIELLKRDAGVDTPVVAYKGAGPMLNDIMGGQIQLIADPMASSSPLAASGKIKALAVTSLKRVSAAPNIPTIAESGMTEFEFSSWYGLWGRGACRTVQLRSFRPKSPRSWRSLISANVSRPLASRRLARRRLSSRSSSMRNPRSTSGSSGKQGSRRSDFLSPLPERERVVSSEAASRERVSSDRSAPLPAASRRPSPASGRGESATYCCGNTQE